MNCVTFLSSCTYAISQLVYCPDMFFVISNTVEVLTPVYSCRYTCVVGELVASHILHSMVMSKVRLYYRKLFQIKFVDMRNTHTL
jgi:hypothetical protein